MKRLVLLLCLFLFSCSSDEDITYVLKLDTSMANPQTLVFSQISLPNHNFTISQEEQTLTINKGLSSTNDVRVTLNFACFNKLHNQDVQVNFYKDQTTTIKLTQHSQSQIGCRLTFTVSYD